MCWKKKPGYPSSDLLILNKQFMQTDAARCVDVDQTARDGRQRRPQHQKQLGQMSQPRHSQGRRKGAACRARAAGSEASHWQGHGVEQFAGERQAEADEVCFRQAGGFRYQRPQPVVERLSAHFGGEADEAAEAEASGLSASTSSLAASDSRAGLERVTSRQLLPSDGGGSTQRSELVADRRATCGTSNPAQRLAYKRRGVGRDDGTGGSTDAG
ncbi:hypothetical protein TRIUR3_32503 [Triticum urartu]|uniref:Uncharacterized protein n=1 Tax=Triticum urartu TaxID=4572 RepID=M7Z6N6_TRIUA|nr:hypothetical protein TRIUR3_32503 [Triticum urartu]